MIEVPVLIAGGGPVGLTASFMLRGSASSRCWSSAIPAPPSIPRRAASTPAPWRSSTSRASRPASARPACRPSSVGLIVWTQARSPARRSSVACRGGQSASAPRSRRCAPACAPRTISSRCCGAAPSGSPRRAALQHRAHVVRAGRDGRRRHAHQHGDGRHREGAGAVPDRRRRHAKPRAQRARHRHARREGRL